MAYARKNGQSTTSFQSISVEGLPNGRKGKHNQIVLALLSDLESLENGRALKIPLSELPDTKVNIRAALNRATRKRNIDVATASDEENFYVWKPSDSL